MKNLLTQGSGLQGKLSLPPSLMFLEDSSVLLKLDNLRTSTDTTEAVAAANTSLIRFVGFQNRQLHFVGTTGSNADAAAFEQMIHGHSSSILYCKLVRGKCTAMKSPDDIGHCCCCFLALHFRTNAPSVALLEAEDFFVDTITLYSP